MGLASNIYNEAQAGVFCHISYHKVALHTIPRPPCLLQPLKPKKKIRDATDAKGRERRTVSDFPAAPCASPSSIPQNAISGPEYRRQRQQHPSHPQPNQTSPVPCAPPCLVILAARAGLSPSRLVASYEGSISASLPSSTLPSHRHAHASERGKPKRACKHTWAGRRLAATLHEETCA